MRFRCPFCYYIINADDMSRGYPVQCAGCGKNVTTPVGRFDNGCIIGDFVINAKLGEGSIGAVYKATQLSLDRLVALKILSPEYTNAKGISDFLKEARAAATLSHTNLVQSYAVGEEDGTCYLAMTYISGENVKTRLKREGSIPVDESLHIIQQVAEALFYAWDEAGLIHRDVKPDNIMVTTDGIVKLTDMGLAMNQAEWSENMDISGSPSYMSPEQFSGEKLDTRSDIYSLGITLYQMLSGQLPYRGDSIKEIAKLHFETEAAPLRKLNKDIPPAVEQLVKKMMAKLPEDRYANMEELLMAVWTIRQKTAPNKSLVPDVHTISIKRLDYEIQAEASAFKSKEASVHSVSLLKDRIITAFVTLITGLVILFLFYFIFGWNKGESIKLYEKVAYFEKLSGDRGIETASAVAEGKKILEELPLLKTKTNQFNRLKMESLLSLLEVKNLQTQLSAAETLREKTEVELKKATAELWNLRKRKIALEKSESSASGEIAELKAKIKHDQNELAECRKKESEMKKLSGWTFSALTETRKTEIRMRLLELQISNRFKEAASYIALMENKYPAFEKWLSLKKEENHYYQKIFAELSESGIKYSGKVIDSNGSKIVAISGGFVDYNDSFGRIRRRQWTEIPTDTAASMLAKEFPKDKLKKLRSSVEYLKGEFGAAVKDSPKNKELAAAVNDYIADQVLKLKSIAPVSKKRTENRSLALLKQLEGHPSYEKIQTELANLYSAQKTTP